MNLQQFPSELEIPRAASPFQGFFTLGYNPAPHSGVLHFFLTEIADEL